MDHKKAHFRVEGKSIWHGLILLILCAIFQIVAIFLDNDWLKAIALRIYYLPVLFTSIRGGMFSGAIVAFVSAATHLGIMFAWTNPRDELSHDAHALIEHGVEMPFLMIAAVVTGLLRDHFLLIEEEKRNIENIFERYVSKTISKKIINNEIHTEGEILEATVLFADIRAFTELSEGATPQQILVLLNQYFSAMTEVLLDHGAFIDKFIGDAIMAVFGVPLPDENSADKAVGAAIQMKQRLSELNACNEFGEHHLDISIGLHTGSLVAGLIGSKRRQDYTVIGDTVNLASRVEALNRMYHTHILISDATKNRVTRPEALLMREMDSVRVKGRHAPTVIYEIYNVCGPKMRQLKQETLADFGRGMAFYKAANWSLAEGCFREVLKRYTDDPISKLYLRRISELKKNPPSNWDGVYTLKKK